MIDEWKKTHKGEYKAKNSDRYIWTPSAWLYELRSAIGEINNTRKFMFIEGGKTQVTHKRDCPRYAQPAVRRIFRDEMCLLPY